MKLYLVIVVFAVVNADYHIDGNFSLCYQTDQIVDFDLQSGQFNSLNILRAHEDEFQFIDAYGSLLIVYCNNGQLYSTSCISINEIIIPSFFNSCCVDLPVYFLQENVKNIVFLTKSGILQIYF